MNIILYTIGCPICKKLAKKLDAAGITYNTVTDKQTMIDLGFTDLPILEVDGKRMEVLEAMKWLNATERN